MNHFLFLVVFLAIASSLASAYVMRTMPSSIVQPRLTSRSKYQLTPSKSSRLFVIEPNNEVVKPPSNDICASIVSGSLGTDPREAFLKNGHSLASFSIGFTGHYTPIHDWEQGKNAETTWFYAEAWDDVGKEIMSRFRKGDQLSGLGYCLTQKWKDKLSGEEKKTLKLRITKLLSKAELDKFVDSNGLRPAKQEDVGKPSKQSDMDDPFGEIPF